MYYTYILKNKENKLYKGYTSNLEKRLKEHNSGHTRTTSNSSSWEVVYFETFELKEEAIAKEKYFKTAAGRRFIKFKLNLKTIGAVVQRIE